MEEADSSAGQLSFRPAKCPAGWLPPSIIGRKEIPVTKRRLAHGSIGNVVGCEGEEIDTEPRLAPRQRLIGCLDDADVGDASNTPARFIGRVTWLPWRRSPQNLLHVGMSGRWAFSSRSSAASTFSPGATERGGSGTRWTWATLSSSHLPRMMSSGMSR